LDYCGWKRFGAVEWIRTTTVLLPPAPQAGASASSATTAPFVFNELEALSGARCPFWCPSGAVGFRENRPFRPARFTFALPSRPEPPIYKVTAGSCAKRPKFSSLSGGQCPIRLSLLGTPFTTQAQVETEPESKIASSHNSPRAV